MGGIFIIKGDRELVEMEEQPYASENILQSLLEKYPQLLAGKQMNDVDPRRWLLICREAGLPGEESGSDRWAIDHLFVDQDGIPTIVEVKRSTDTRIRREVIGQMLDYASNAVVYWPIEKIRSMFELTCERSQINSEDCLLEFLGPNANVEEFWGKFKTNLQAGKIRMIFVADQIPPELQRVVEFLNEQMDSAEVLALEIKQYAGDQLKTLVPRVIGLTSDARKRKGTETDQRQWDEQSFFSRLDSEQGKIARKILDWAKPNMPRIWWGKGSQDGSFIPVLDMNGIGYYAIAVRTGYKNPHIQLQFQPLSNRPPFDEENLRLDFLKRLNKIPGIDLPPEAINKYPSFKLDKLGDDKSLNQFIEALDWIVSQIRTSRKE
jgi:hypothetical protein